jgi:hypothetical protein
MDTESYSPIRGQKISNAILWAPVFTPLAEQCHFPFWEVISYFKKGCETDIGTGCSYQAFELILLDLKCAFQLMDLWV